MKGWAINQILFAISIFASNDHEINRLNNRDFNIDQKKNHDYDFSHNRAALVI